MQDYCLLSLTEIVSAYLAVQQENVINTKYTYDGRNSPMQQATIDQLLRSSLLPCWQSTGVLVNKPGYHRQGPQLIHPIEVIGGNVLAPPMPCPGPMRVTIVKNQRQCFWAMWNNMLMRMVVETHSHPPSVEYAKETWLKEIDSWQLEVSLWLAEPKGQKCESSRGF